MADVLLKRLNTRGIPAILSTNVSSDGKGTTTVTFNNHPYVSDRFAGGFWVKIAQNLSGTDVILFATSGVANSTVPLYLSNGVQATAANIASNGNAVNLCFYDSDTGRLQVIK